MSVGFDRARFAAALTTRQLGRTLLVRESAVSTNDEAWDAWGAGLGDGVTVIADVQSGGRGRAGRSWTHAPGLGLAMSVALHLGCDVRQAGILPLAVGLAIARACERLGVSARLKWPNDVLVSGRKIAGVLCEMRRDPRGGEVVVIGIGFDVRHRREDFPPELREIATSLAIEGTDVTLEVAAATILAALEPLWAEVQEGDRAAVLAAWSEAAAFWGEPVTVRTPAGETTGVAQRLDADGALVLRMDSGVETTIVAGDLETGSRHEASGS